MHRTALTLCLAVTACGPRIAIKRELPARVDLGADARVMSVRNAHHESVLGVILDPFGALSRTVLTPHAVRQLELGLSKSPRYQVIPRCGDVCPAADTRVEVSVTNARIEPGNAQSSKSKEGEATLAVRVLKRSGEVAWQHGYRGTVSGGIPGGKYETSDNDMLTGCVNSAVEDFVRDLHPQWIRESFRMEDEGPLEQCAKLAVAGDLDGAENVARVVLKTQPSNAQAIYNLGAIFTARGQLEQALDAFRGAAALDKKYAGYAKAAAQRLTDRGVLQNQSQ